MIIFVSMNVVKYYVLQPQNAYVNYRKQPSVIYKKYWSNFILRQNNYVQQTNTCKLVFIVLRSNRQRIWNSELHISITLQTLPSIVIL